MTDDSEFDHFWSKENRMSDKFESGPLKGNSKLTVIAITATAIILGCAISWYSGLFAALS